MKDLNPSRSLISLFRRSTVSGDKLTYTFTLRDTIWSNNTPVTAYDFERTWKDILDPSFPSVNAYLFSMIKNAQSAKKGLVPLDQVGIKALDAKTLQITLDRPTPYLFKLLASYAFFPIDIANDQKNPNWAYTGDQCACNGPFILEKWDHGSQVIVRRNPSYRKTKDLHPEKIVFNIVENNAVTLEMFKQGSIDMVGDALTDIPLEDIPALEKKWTFRSKPSSRSRFININTEKFPFNHPKIRRAFGLAINRQQLLGLIGKGIKKNISTSGINIAYQADLSATNIVTPCVKENRYSYFFKDNDVTQAKILLEEGMAELGITKEAFKSIVFHCCSQAYGASEIMQIIQQQWLNALGIFLKLEKLDFSTGLDKLRSGDYSICFVGWASMYYDPINFLERFKYKSYITNFSNWENPKFIELLDRSDYEDGEKRLLTLEEAEKVLIEEMPVIPLYHQDCVYLINPNLPFDIPLWEDRMLLPLSSEGKNIQKENKNAWQQEKNLGRTDKD